MNFANLPQELCTKIIKYSHYLTISKIRQTCHGMNDFIQRKGLDKMNAYSVKIEKLADSSETVAIIEMGYELFRGEFIHNSRVVYRFLGNELSNMCNAYEALFSQLRVAHKIDLYKVPVNVQLIRCLAENRIDSKQISLVMTNCLISMNASEAKLFFSKFNEIRVTDCMLPKSFMCAEVLSVMMINNTKLEIPITNIIRRYTTITDGLVDSIIHSPFMSTCKLDMRRLHTNITFAKIKELVEKFIKLTSFYSADFDFGHLDHEERNAVRTGIPELELHKNIVIFTDNARERYVSIKVYNKFEANQTSSDSEANFIFFVREA